MLHSQVDSPVLKAWYSQTSTRETRNVKCADFYLFNERDVSTCFSLRRLAVDVVSNLVIFAVYRAWPHPNPPECLSYTLPPCIFILSFVSQSVEPILREGITCTIYILVISELSQSETTPDPGP